MNQVETQEKLSLTQKLDLMYAIFNRKSIRGILDEFSSAELVDAHAFLWDKLVEIHYWLRPSEFRREEVTQKMVSSAAYQRQQGCDLRLDYCKGVECIWSHPVCAGNKVKNNMEVMAQTIIDYLQSTNHISASANKEDKSREEVRLWF